MKLRVGAKVVILIDFEIDVSHFVGVNGRLLNRYRVKHLTFVHSLEQKHHILGEEAIRISVLQVSEGYTNRTSGVLQVIVCVLSLRQDAQNVDFLSLADDSMNIEHPGQITGLLISAIHELGFDKHIVVREDSFFHCIKPREEKLTAILLDIKDVATIVFIDEAHSLARFTDKLRKFIQVTLAHNNYSALQKVEDFIIEGCVGLFRLFNMAFCKLPHLRIFTGHLCVSFTRCYRSSLLLNFGLRLHLLK